ncbi:MAG: M56 family metallopeptidase [Saprospiraceae bacterium]|nr:M56 family metallopeptidase [Saprospiraceae bacterium]
MNTAFLAFYAFYLILLKDKTFFQWNRFFLPVGLLVAFLLPFIQFPEQEILPAVSTPGLLREMTEPVVQEAWLWQYETLLPLQQKAVWFTLTVGQLAIMLYLLGLSFYLVKFCLGLTKLYRIIKSSKLSNWGATSVLLHPQARISSFFSYLFWKEETTDQDHLMIEHEKVHIRHWHSVDILFLELSKIILWFNPLIRHLVRELRLLHEYIADSIVVNKFDEKTNYAQLLYNAVTAPAPDILHTFYSFTKNRLNMLHRPKSSKMNYLNYFLSLPVFAVAGILMMKPAEGTIMAHINSRTYTLQEEPLTLLRQVGEQENGVYFQWGDIQIPLAGDPQQKGFFSVNIDLEKAELLRNMKSMIEIVDLRKEEDPISLKTLKIALNCSSFKFNEPGLIKEYEIPDIESFHQMSQDIKDQASRLKDGCRVFIQANAGKQFLSVNLFIRDAATRITYLEAGEQRFIAERYSPEIPSFPNFPSDNTNKIDPSNLKELLRNNKLKIIDLDKSFEDVSTAFYHLKDLSKPISTDELLQAINVRIEEPLAVLTTTSEGSTYISIFDDEYKALVEYENWQEYYAAPRNLHIHNRYVKEKVEFDWEDLKLTSPDEPMHFRIGQPFRKQGLHYDEENNLSKSHVKKLLRNNPSLVIDDESIKDFVISFKYIDHEYLPFKCRLTYKNGELAEGGLFIEKLKKLLKQNDFIENLEVTVDGQTKISGIGFKVK